MLALLPTLAVNAHDSCELKDNTEIQLNETSEGQNVGLKTILALVHCGSRQAR